MSGFRFLAPAVLLALIPAVDAQQFSPHAGYVYPAGGKQGTSFEVAVGGQFLDGVSNAYISGSGIQLAVVKYVKPITQGQFNQMREQLKELAEKKAAAAKAQKRGAAPAAGAPWTPEDEKKVAEIREKLGTFVRRPASPAIAEIVTLKVTLAPDATPGERELRLATPVGMTNPMMFCVGQLPEHSKEPAKVIETAYNGGKGARFRPEDVKKVAPTLVTLPAIVNGQITPGGVDRYRFAAPKGQRLVIAASARELIPYISDAVPGWFQATLTLYDAKGKEVKFADHYRFHPDPVLYYEIPEQGDYTLEVRDSIYRGREDFVYRIALGEFPFITGIFPLGGKAGSKTSVELRGWNLPTTKVTQDFKGKKTAGAFPVSVRKGEWTSNQAPFAVDLLNEKTEKETNDTAKNAQSLKMPVIVNGRIERPGDWDVFRIDGKAGEEIAAEVLARRLDSPLDSILKLTDAGGKQLAVNDDFEDKGTGLLTHHADSRILFKLPKNGTYYLHLGDAQNKGGSDYAYRLRVGRPQPDFDLRVAPASINARAGMTVPITVYALRKDGFNGEIALKLKDAPQGFVLSGATIPAGQDKVRLTLTVPASRIEKPRSIALEGRANIAGRDCRRQAVPAEDMMQAFFYRHLVPAKDWLVRVTGAGRTVSAWKMPADKPVKLSAAGGTALPVQVSVNLGRFSGQVRLALSEPPDGITIQKVTPSAGGLSVLLRTEPGKVKAGLRGNLILEAFLESANPAAKQKANALRRQALGTLPALPFEVAAGI